MSKVAIIILILLCILFISINPFVAAYPLEQGKYIEIVENFADMAIEHGRDEYGSVHSPLFVDALNVRTKESYIYRIPDSVVSDTGHPKEQIISSFHIAQVLHITLKELSRLNGDAKYANAAKDAATYGVNNLQHENGLFWMGQHTSYDLKTEKHVGLSGKIIDGYGSTMHEMGQYYPDWRVLHAINPAAVEKYIGEYWAMCLGGDGWENFHFGRHLSYTYSAMYHQGGAPFKRTYLIDDDYPLPYYLGTAADFARQADMIYMAFFYYNVTGDTNALKAGKSLVDYYMRMKFANGLGASRYAWDDESGIVAVETVDFWGHRYTPTLHLFFKMAEMLEGDPVSDELYDWGVGEAVPFAELKVGDGNIERKRLWALAYAYRRTGDPKIWAALRKIFSHYDLGDIGTSPGVNMNLKFDSYQVHIPPSNTGDYRSRVNNEEEYMTHALLEIYKATGEQEYLELAAYTADQMISELLYYGFFVRQPKGLYARLGDGKYLALLHLEAAMRGEDLDSDSVMYRYVFYRSTHEGYGKDWDNVQFYWILDDSSPQTCESLGYDCCGTCLSGPHTGYDGTCSGNSCCDECTPFQADCTGLSLLYHFDEDSSTVEDFSGNGNDGTVYGVAHTESGRFAGAFDFDGNGDYIDTGDINGIDTATQLSGCAWVYHNSLNSDAAIFSKTDSTGWTNGVLLFRDDEGTSGRDDQYKIYVADSTDTDNLYVEGAQGSSEIEAWTHVCFTYIEGSSTGLRLYVNGQEDPNSPASTIGIGAINSGSAALRIGLGNNDGRDFDGMIDEAAIWSRVLSASEIYDLYINSGPISCDCVEDWTCTSWSAWSACSGGTETRTRTCTDQNGCGTTINKPDETETQACGAGELVGHWTFDDSDISGSQALDVSGNGNHGTINGATQLSNGRIGEALSFNGNGDHVNIGLNKIGPDLNSASGTTASAWVRIDSYPAASSRERIFSAMMAGGTTGISLNLFNGGNLEAGGRSVSTDSFQTARTSFPGLNAWHLMTGVFDYPNDRIYLYIDGVLETSQTVTFTNTAYTQAAPASDDTIGANQFGDDGFIDGAIDDVRIYSYALSAEEIEDIFEAVPCHPADTDPPFGCIDFDELFSFIDLWKQNQATIGELMEGIGIWKGGC